jgi:hypothetical protein
MFTGYNVNYTQVLNHIHSYHNVCLGFLYSQLIWQHCGRDRVLKAALLLFLLSAEFHVSGTGYKQIQKGWICRKVPN